MDTSTNPETTIFVNTYPSPGEQLISAGIAIGLTVVSIAAVTGTFFVVGKVSEKMEARKAAKDAKKTPLTAVK